MPTSINCTTFWRRFMGVVISRHHYFPSYSFDAVFSKLLSSANFEKERYDQYVIEMPDQLKGFITTKIIPFVPLNATLMELFFFPRFAIS